MKKLTFILLLVFLISGCATVPKNTKPVIDEQVKTEDTAKPIKAEISKTAAETKLKSKELQNIKNEQLDEYAEKKGVIFAKTEFQGVLKTHYVRLLFEGQKDTTNKFQLLIGSDNSETNFPWDVKTVKPGYFFIELPAGKYKISSISIPVGSSVAEEKADIFLEVIPGAVTYIGTLKINGTKEKIRLGGVPVIKPGFEYEVSIIDNREEGIAAFHQRYPEFAGEINIDLMKTPVSGNQPLK